MFLSTKADYDRIVRIGQSILSLHQEKGWKHKTRSNYAYHRIENVYYAMEELEMVLASWLRISEQDFKEHSHLLMTNDTGKQNHSELKRAKKHYCKIFKQSEIVPQCINSLISLRSLLRKYFTDSLAQVFPRHIPVEVNLSNK